MEARRWVNEVSGEALFDCYLTVRSREVSYNDFTKPKSASLMAMTCHILISVIFRTHDELENQIFP